MGTATLVTVPMHACLLARALYSSASVYYSIATCEPGDNPAPHVRTVVHRGFVNEQRDAQSKTGVKPFDSSFGSNSCLITTTDVRAPKAQQITKCLEEAKIARGEISWWMESKNLQVNSLSALALALVTHSAGWPWSPADSTCRDPAPPSPP